jgi:hypothetical protein
MRKLFSVHDAHRRENDSAIISIWREARMTINYAVALFVFVWCVAGTKTCAIFDEQHKEQLSLGPHPSSSPPMILMSRGASVSREDGLERVISSKLALRAYAKLKCIKIGVGAARPATGMRRAAGLSLIHFRWASLSTAAKGSIMTTPIAPELAGGHTGADM